MLLKLTLTPVREDQDRYWSIVSYERVGERVQGIRRVYRWLDTGRGWRFTCVRVSVLRRVPGLREREWPRGLPQVQESEELRRERIRAVRRAVHVDRVKGDTEPDWYQVLLTSTRSVTTVAGQEATP